MAELDDFVIRWSNDGMNAVIRSRDDSFTVRLHVEEWYGDQEVEGQPAWVASWLDPVSVITQNCRFVTTEKCRSIPQAAASASSTHR